MGHPEVKCYCVWRDALTLVTEITKQPTRTRESSRYTTSVKLFTTQHCSIHINATQLTAQLTVLPFCAR